MARTYRFTIGSAEAGLRLDHYLVRRLPSDMSRRMIQRGVKQGRVILRQRPAKPHDKLRAGDVITAMFPELRTQGGDTPLIPQEIPLRIVYEDDWLLVVNKPAGLVTHPAPGHWDGTLVNAILWHLQNAEGSRYKAQGKSHSLQPSALSLEQPLPRAGIVHRLDKDTSGLLLVAKTEQTHIALSRQLKARTIHRTYLALVEGHLPLDEGTVNVPIGRHLIHRKEMTVRHLGGRQAVTHYRVIKRLDSAQGSRLKAQGNDLQPSAFSLELLPFPYTLLEVTLDTGRTHQIRVHMAHLGHPVIGDTTYGNHPASYWVALGITRQLLHAAKLSFEHPVHRRTVQLSAAIPEEMARWVPS
ncbi:MAG: RluA family pseudouridine synthase [Candidatus Omnitrophica bacterium]|nr:RluA family pseudouridine synthase [Candidatus Omnitrophota bacterium]